MSRRQSTFMVLWLLIFISIIVSARPGTDIWTVRIAPHPVQAQAPDAISPDQQFGIEMGEPTHPDVEFAPFTPPDILYLQLAALFLVIIGWQLAMGKGSGERLRIWSGLRDQRETQ